MNGANLEAGIRKAKSARVVHNLVAQTARAFACEFYEEAARDNGFYAEWPDMREFVDRNWNSFSNAARQTLAGMLGQDYPEHTKQAIYDALLKDGAFNHGQASVH